MKIFNIKIIEQFFIRSKTNTGSLCKQYFYLITNKGTAGYTLVIHKYDLVENHNLEYYHDLNYIKKFKGKYLFFEHFAIKLDTLTMALLKVSDCITKTE